MPSLKPVAALPSICTVIVKDDKRDMRSLDHGPYVCRVARMGGGGGGGGDKPLRFDLRQV